MTINVSNADEYWKVQPINLAWADMSVEKLNHRCLVSVLQVARSGINRNNLIRCDCVEIFCLKIVLVTTELTHLSSFH